METREYANETREFIGKPAAWLVRHGTLLLTATVVALVSLASFYTYPTTLRGTLVLTTVDPPRQLEARQEMAIQEVLVPDRSVVQAGQTLVLAANSRARLENVMYLEDQLIEHRGEDADALLDLQLSPTLILGPLEESVYAFKEQQERYRNLTARRLDGYTSAELQRMIAQTERQVRQLRGQEAPLGDRLAGARLGLDRERQLASEGLQDGDQLELARERVERDEEAVQANAAALRAASFSIELMRNQIESYRSGRQGSTTGAAAGLKQAYDELQQAVANWKRDFTVVSPINGRVVFQPDVRADNFLPRGRLVATVLPLDAGTTVGRMQLDVTGSGKVAVGQEVVVHFLRWPHLEYGSVRGEIAKVGLVPVEHQLLVDVRFPAGMRTNTGFTLESAPYMEGEATIIVERQRLLARLLDVF